MRRMEWRWLESLDSFVLVNVDKGEIIHTT